MILKLYDLDHVPIAGLKNVKDASIESLLNMGEKTLNFSWHSKNLQKIPVEYYVRTDTDEFVVKENSASSNGYRKITAKLSLEGVEGKTWEAFIGEGLTAKEMADYALADTGWTCVSAVPEDKKRNISLTKINSFNIFEKIIESFGCEVTWNSIHKKVYLKEKAGADKGAYFIKGLNLKELSDSCNTYDYATRIIPIGADDLNITSVNNGNNYLENYQYSPKIKTIIWEDGNYTDPQALMEDAEYKLNEISKPKRTYQAKVFDLAKMKTEYSILEYSVGDTVILVDNEQGIREQQRITKTVEYIGNPQKNTCEISNTVLSFEDMQKRLFAAAESVDNITIGNGTVKGSTIDSIDVTQIIGLDRYISEEMDQLKVNFLYVKSEFGTPLATIGKLINTEAQITKLDVAQRADIELEHVKESHIKNLYADYLKVPVLEADNLSAVFEKVNHLEADYAKIDFTNINTASISQGFLHQLMVDQGIVADRIVSGEVVITGALTGVNIYAEDITAGTLSVDRLILRGSDKSLIYALNNSGELISKQVDTLDADILTERTITGNKIIANAITSKEINTHDLVVTGLIGANKLTAQNINVNDLFAMNITAAGSIQSTNYAYTSGNYSANGIKLDMSTGGVISKKFAIDVSGNAYFSGNLSAPTGTIGGFTIGAEYLANGTDRLGTTANSVYVGIGGISCGTDFTVTKEGKLIAANVNVKQQYSLFYNNTDDKSVIIQGGSVSGGTYWRPDYRILEVGILTGVIQKPSIRFEAYNNGGSGLIKLNGAAIISGAAEIYGRVSAPNMKIGNWSADGYKFVTEDFICSSWIRTSGQAGWFSETYGGGWHMTDTSWIRSYNGKNVYCNNQIRANNFHAENGATIQGMLRTDTLSIVKDLGINSGTWGAAAILITAQTNLNGGVRPSIAFENRGYTAAAIWYDVDGHFNSIRNDGANYQFFYNGDWVKLNSPATYNNPTTQNANVYISSNYNLCRSTSSSRRYKHDIRKIKKEELKALYNLPICKYKYNADYVNTEDERYMSDIPGIIVEDLEAILPIAVNHENGLPEMWNSNILVPCILGLTQDLNRRLTPLEGLRWQVNELQNKLEEAEREIKKLKNTAA